MISDSYACDGDPPSSPLPNPNTAWVYATFFKDSLHIKIKEDKQVKYHSTFASKLPPFPPPPDSRNTELLLEELMEDGEEGRWWKRHAEEAHLSFLSEGEERWQCSMSIACKFYSEKSLVTQVGNNPWGHRDYILTAAGNSTTDVWLTTSLPHSTINNVFQQNTHTHTQISQKCNVP